MWADAVFPIICMEWQPAAEGAARPLLRASAEVLMSGPSLYPPRPSPPGVGSGASGGGGGDGKAVAAATVAKMMGLGGSAAAAIHAYHASQRLVAALQLRQLVQAGSVSKQPPVPVPADWDQRSMDIGEGHQVEGRGTMHSMNRGLRWFLLPPYSYLTFRWSCSRTRPSPALSPFRRVRSGVCTSPSRAPRSGPQEAAGAYRILQGSR